MSSRPEVTSYPRQDADTSRHHVASRPFRVSTVHYPDDRDRLTVTRARTHARTDAGAKATFCPCGFTECAFDPERIFRHVANSQRAIARAKDTVVELARCNSLDHLVTLTAGPHFAGRMEALGALSAFLADRRHGRWFAAHVGSYVSVAGPSSAGGWHLHVGIRGRLDAVVLLRLKESWTRFLASAYDIPAPEGGGHWRVNVSAPRGRCSPASLGAYLAKHIDSAAKGQKSYRRALGMARAVRESVVVLMTPAVARGIVAVFGRPERIVHPRTGAVLGWTTEGRGVRGYVASLGLKEVTG